MEGKIKSKLHNGFVFIESDDGQEYITHDKQIGFKTKVGRRVSFEPGKNPVEDGKYPWAENVQRLDFLPSQNGEADWVVLPVELRKMQVKIDWCRCGSCGEQSTNAFNFCPKCGAKMNRSDEIIAMAKEVYKEA